MKQLIVAVASIWLGFSATAQSSAPPASPPPATPTEGASAQLSEPLSATAPDNTRYLNDPKLLTGCQAQLAAFSDKPCDIIFIGDSITEGWLDAGKAIWKKNYVPRHALNFGVDGDKTQNVLWRLTNMQVQNLKPQVAVIMIGANNIANNPHEIADGIKAVIANTQEAFSGVKIILVSLTPNQFAPDQMRQVNSLIKNYADESTVYYLNLIPLMPEVTTTTPDGQTDTNWKGLGKDHLHPDASGYQIWANAMEPLLKKLLGEK